MFAEAILFGLLTFVALPAERAVSKPFAVIVANESDPQPMTRDDAASIFRRKQTFWKNGRRVQPVNLPVGDPLRQAFSRCILGQAPEALEDYWRQMYFQGVLPPRVLESERAVTLFVATTPGGIGYVSACSNDPRITVLLTFGDVPNCPKRPAMCTPLQDS
jgi:ABC-type phosphate transport system substrate-binding protein